MAYEIKVNTNILKVAAPGTYATIAGMVNNTNVSADSDGRKIIPAGTALKPSTGTIVAGRNIATVMTANSDAVEVLLFSDVDVTDGTTAATFLINGIIDSNKIPDAVDATVKATLVAKGFTFVG